ncbi:30S ribosomal protein S17 [Sedimentisphaera salicampi]|uniref:Small ribosomal subunit protein uS17 n=1 Tax=Sedimentisphaera salicampi TaxID=1941349 RepID=A0A1W6LPE1_9BACT|nr:30S ribosomal protein S17 [Sedimentisphaera salicampi]ARN57658.1 30S ribosomal protein S17 [Sedimentisphaera salicampi]OXU14223.1 30S ribosomal protein S17 [Sedimentisphaera salicampi]
MEGKVFKTRRGTVVSRSGDKAIRVQIDYNVKHPVYGKYVKRRTKLGVHDPQNAASVGDIVDIVECRPISKTISWRLVGLVEQANIK